MEKIIKHIDANRQRYEDELFDLLRIPSVSANPEHAGDIRRAAEWVRAKLESVGYAARLYETPGHPLVYGEWLNVPGNSHTGSLR